MHILDTPHPWARTSHRPYYGRASQNAACLLPIPGRGQAIAPTMDGLRRLILRSMVGAMACPRPVTLHSLSHSPAESEGGREKRKSEECKPPRLACLALRKGTAVPLTPAA